MAIDDIDDGETGLEARGKINASFASLNASLDNWIRGLHVSNGTDADHDVDIAVGGCRGLNDLVDILSTSVLTVAIDASGANGLDTGTVTTNTMYSLFIISKANGDVAGVFSLSETAPTMPATYTTKRRVCGVRTDGSSNILQFFQERDEQRNRIMWYSNWSFAAPYLLQINGANTGAEVATTTSAATLTPSTATGMYLYVSATKTLSNNFESQVLFQPHDWPGQAFRVNCGLDDPEDIKINTQRWIPIIDQTDRTVEYAVVQATGNIYLSAYRDLI